MNVSAIIVTRGDIPPRGNLMPIIASMPEGMCEELLVWENTGALWRYGNNGYFIRSGAEQIAEVKDLSVYGRYAAIEYATCDLIYVQDDDCVVSDPAEIVTRWLMDARVDFEGHVVSNMPQQFRHDFYADHSLVGFGAVFHRDAPERAFQRLFPEMSNPDPTEQDEGGWWDYSLTQGEVTITIPSPSFFQRTCDVVFTALTPRVLVDVPYTNLAWAEDDTRMYRQPGHVEERQRMLDLVRKVRDG